MVRGLLTAVVCIGLAVSARGDEVYMHQYGSGQILMYDTDAAVLTQVGDTNQDGFFALAAAPVPVPNAGGGFWAAGTLFGLDRDSGSVYVVDKADASLTLIGQDENNLSNATGLAFDLTGTLYAVRDGDEDGEFYAISTETGVATYLGFSGESQLDGLTVVPVDTEVWGYGVVPAGDFLASSGGFLYRVEAGSLVTTYLGDVYPSAHQTLDFNPQGVLYTHGGWYNPNLYITTLNPLANIFVADVGERVDGMAVIPEPSTVVLCGLGVIVVGLGRRCGRVKDACAVHSMMK